MKLAIAVPCCRDWKVTFGVSMIGLTRHLESKKVNFDMNIMRGASVLPRARQLAVGWAKSINATHLLFIDDDMQFSASAVDSLVSRNLDITACNYLSKAVGRPLVHDVDGKVMTSEGKSGVEEVGWAGFGLILIKLDAIKDIPMPLFEACWLPERNDFIGEDFYFCKKVREYGVKIHCDHDASQMAAHIGDMAYGFSQRNQSSLESAA